MYGIGLVAYVLKRFVGLFWIYFFLVEHLLNSYCLD